MGRTHLPARIRHLLPPEHREPRKRPQPADTGRRDLLQRAGADSELELILLNRLERAGLPLGEPQFHFVPGRQHRFDRAWPEIDGRSVKVAVEVMGGTWSQNGHARPSKVNADMAKLSMAAALGWRVLPLTKEMIESGRAVELIAQALGLEAKP